MRSFWLVLASLVACGGGRSGADAGVSEARAPDAARPPAVICAAPDCAVIADGGVGEVRIGAPLPPALLPADAEARHVARFIADAVPLEGFRLESPPVLAVVRGKKAPTGKASAKVARQAVELGRAGKLRVESVHVEDPAPRTALGAGVGSTLAELRLALGVVRFHPVPPTYGGDECVATAPALEGVWFYFESCRAVEADGRVVRVLVVDPRE